MPTALNLGQIIQPYTQPGQTGGMGLNQVSPLAGGSQSVSLFSAGGTTSYILYGGIALVAGLLLWVVMKK